MNIFLKTQRNSLHLLLTKTYSFNRNIGRLSSFQSNTTKTIFSFSKSEKNPDKKTINNINNPESEIFITKARRPENILKRSFTLYDISEITKFRLCFMNSSVAMVTYLIMDPTLDSRIMLFFLATQMIAMSSQTSNQDIEKEYDKLMIRTCNRPLPKNRIESIHARIIAGLLFFGSNAIFLSFFPLSATYMANFIFFSYTLVYTPLKRISSINTTVGAISGSLPPFLGWLAAGGAFFNEIPIGICSYMFGWQYSHFYGILWIYQNDYKKAGFKMIEDPLKAVKHMKMALGLKIVSGNLVFAGLGLNPLYAMNAILMAGLWKYCYIPLKIFEEDPSVKNAKNLKKKSYNHLLIFFGVIFANNVWELGKKYLNTNNCNLI